MDIPAPDFPPESSAPDAAPDGAADAAPAALTDLIAAGLVSHEMIGDPALLGAEAPTLGTLCGLIGGPIYRIDPFHYAFRAAPEDLGGGLGRLAPGDWTGALEAALRAGFGADAVWLNATELPPEAGAALDQPLVLLRAQTAAVTAGIAAAAPGLQAVIHARYACETARLTARLITAAEAGTALARRLAVIELRQEEILEAFAEHMRPAGPDPVFARLTETLAAVVQRLDAHLARADDMAERLAALAAPVGGSAGFQETLGLSLAEFLARLERRADEASSARVPRFN